MPLSFVSSINGFCSNFICIAIIFYMPFSIAFIGLAVVIPFIIYLYYVYLVCVREIYRLGKNLIVSLLF